MRISMSMVFALLISFLLLGIMANLVKQPEIGTNRRPPLLDKEPTPPTSQTKPQPPIRVAPRLPQTVATPKGPTVLVEPTDDGDPTITVPPLTPSDSIGEKWTQREVFTPSDERDGHAPEPSNSALIPISQIQPQYPRELAARGVEGWVSLRFEVHQDGSVGNVNVINGSPRGVFDQAARQAVQRWRYRPVEGPVTQTITLDFKLDN